MSFYKTNPIQYSQGVNFDQFIPGTHNGMIPQEAYSFRARGPEYLSGGALGLAPVRPDFGDFPMAAILTVGIIAVAAVMAFALSGDEPRRAF
jgi:hypothetical protein